MPTRPKSVSPPLKIYELKLDRAAIDQMPTDARRNLFLFGHIANEINTLSRSLILSVHTYDDPVVNMYADARSATILRNLTGITFEGLLAVDRSVISSPFGRNYLPHLRSEGQEAFDKVKRHLGDMKLIAGIRNGYSFHLPEQAQLDHAYGKLAIDVNLDIYSGNARHSSLYEMSNSLMMCGMLELVPDSHAMTNEQAMGVIVDDVLEKSIVLNDFIEWLIDVIARKHNLAPHALQEVATVDGTHSVNTFRIPPLLRD